MMIISNPPVHWPMTHAQLISKQFRKEEKDEEEKEDINHKDFKWNQMENETGVINSIT